MPTYRDAQRVQQTISDFADDVRFATMLSALSFEAVMVTQLTNNLSGNGIRLANSFEAKPFPTIHTPASLDVFAERSGFDRITTEQAVLNDIDSIFRAFRVLSDADQRDIRNAQREVVVNDLN